MTETLDHLNLRALPPVEDAPERPERFSQTMLRHGDRCRRAAMLYVKHHGGMPAHQLDRGTAFHLAVAKVTNLLLERYAVDATPGADVDYAVDEDTAKLMLEDVFDEHPELTIPTKERDDLRVMMSHVANGWRIDPAKVVAVERKFILACGDYTVSGVLDLALMDGTLGVIRDWKTSWDLPSQQEFEATFQTRLYAAMLVYGNPVSGHGEDERYDEPLGSHLHSVDVGEVYPRYMQDDGVPVRTMTLDRMQIDEARRDVERLCIDLAASFESGLFPAVAGSHCSECPCEPECPLPNHLRNFAGAIQTEDQAREAAEWLHRVEGKVSATKKEIRSFCKVNGPLRFGGDMVLEFGEVNKWDTDWDAIEAGAVRAAQYGEPFDISQFRRQKLGTAFKARKLTDAELVAEKEATT